MGHRVTKLDPEAHIAYLDDGRTIKYKKCLIATGFCEILIYLSELIIISFYFENFSFYILIIGGAVGIYVYYYISENKI